MELNPYSSENLTHSSKLIPSELGLSRLTKVFAATCPFLGLVVSIPLSFYLNDHKWGTEGIRASVIFAIPFAIALIASLLVWKCGERLFSYLLLTFGIWLFGYAALGNLRLPVPDENVAYATGLIWAGTSIAIAVVLTFRRVVGVTTATVSGMLVAIAFCAISLVFLGVR